MNLALQNELNNADVDWKKIKEILLGIAQALEAVAAMINLVIQMLPDLAKG